MKSMAAFQPAGALAAAGGVTAGFLAWAARGRSSQVFGPSVWRGPAHRAAIALTFDDGPTRDTPRLLDVLARHGVPATFFQCGVNVERLPEMTREVHAAGHEIGNHSHTHPRFWLRRPGFLETELRRAQDAIQQAAGASPVLVRAPYGVRWLGMRDAQQAVGLQGVMWTVLARDWKLPARAVVDRVRRRISNGCIVCLHDGRELAPAPDIRETIQAVDLLIPILRARGFTLETVSQLLCPKT